MKITEKKVEPEYEVYEEKFYFAIATSFGATCVHTAHPQTSKQALKDLLSSLGGVENIFIYTVDNPNK